mmetsp:Transcript_85740/g.135410  ORF Transcript_85740/g.135410 Transcript_85740/m.135410 type:complete len:162 (+) Transcript_85740:68-553(+)
MCSFVNAADFADVLSIVESAPAPRTTRCVTSFPVDGDGSSVETARVVTVRLADGYEEVVSIDPEEGPLALDGSCYRLSDSESFVTAGALRHNLPWKDLSVTTKEVLIHTVAKKNRRAREAAPDFWSAAARRLRRETPLVQKQLKPEPFSEDLRCRLARLPY